MRTRKGAGTGKASRRLTAFDLYCGCGGLTLGLKHAGFAVVGAVEIDLLSAETYKANHPEVRVWEDDIRNVSPRKVVSELRLREGDLDLLAGCPPCQGFSSIRTLNGSRVIADSRNDLLFEFIRFIEVMRPKSVMMENVPGLAIDPRFEEYCRRLSALGYTHQHRMVDAADYGVPQRRRRLISVAGRDLAIRFPQRGSRRRTVRDAIAALPHPGEAGDVLHAAAEHRSSKVKRLIRLVPKDGGSRTDIPRRHWLQCHKATDGFWDVYGRMAWDDVAPTLTGGCINPSKGRFLHPEQDRAITLREAALLQGFPRGYAFSLRQGRFRTAEMIGNAFPPPLAAAHAKRVRLALSAAAHG